MKKYLKIVLIGLILLFTAILIFKNISFANTYNGTIVATESDKEALDRLENYGKDAVGKTIGFTQSVDNPDKELLGQFDEDDHVYCVQHNASSSDGLYVIDAYVKIEGNKATGYFLSGSDTATKKAGSS